MTQKVYNFASYKFIQVAEVALFWPIYFRDFSVWLDQFLTEIASLD